MKSKTKRRAKKGIFRSINDWLHLWLGLTSGIVVFVVSITGCFYAFQQEIRDVTEPWRFVEPQESAFVPPSKLLDTALKYMPDQKPTGLTYAGSDGAAAAGYMGNTNGKPSFSVVFMNPYTGDFIAKKMPVGGSEFDFFRFILDGHRSLWLPETIGRPIVGVATLIFLVLLITGLVMWWPKKWNKANRKKRFAIKTNGSFKRFNYDFHNVLGFYSLVFALVLAITGLVWSFTWFDQALYYVTSGGAVKQEHQHPHSDLKNKDVLWEGVNSPLDEAWYKTLSTTSSAVQGMYMTPYPPDEDDPIDITVYHQQGSWYDHSEYFYDRYTLEPLQMENSSFKESNLATRLSMMNYDIHVGAVGGLPGKVFAFLVSLVCASLPISGFLLWWQKGKKK